MTVLDGSAAEATDQDTTHLRDASASELLAFIDNSLGRSPTSHDRRG